jgi:hypothetical protein
VKLCGVLGYREEKKATLFALSHSQVRQCHYEYEYGLLEKQQYALLEKATLALSNCNQLHTVHSYSKRDFTQSPCGFQAD